MIKIKLDKKYVLHIPLAKMDEDKLVSLEIDDILSNLFDLLSKKGFDVFYVSKVQGHYAENVYDQLLVTVFTASENEDVGEIFRGWFIDNNDILGQMEFAYEFCGVLFVEKLHK